MTFWFILGVFAIDLLAVQFREKSMSNYKVTYFDIDGGRAEPIRIALHCAGLAFEDVRWSFPEFGEKRTGAPFHAVPFLEMDGQVITQSNAISRYLGKKCNLYPDDPLQALYCDEVLDALEDLNHYVVQTFGLKGDELKQAREALMNGRLTVFLKGLDGLLTRGGGQYFANGGNLDHIPADFVDTLCPALAELQERVDGDPIVQAYYASRNT